MDRRIVVKIGIVAIFTVATVTLATGAVFAESSPSDLDAAQMGDIPSQTDSQTVRTLQEESTPPQIDDITITPDNPSVGETVEFQASASDPDGSDANLRYEWEIGSGYVTLGRLVSYTFAESGNHDVTLTVTDEDGASTTVQETVSVNAPPRVGFAVEPETPTAYEEAQFISDGFDTDGQIVLYEWAVDGQPAGSGENLRWTFASPGEHEVTVTGVDDDGASTSNTQIITVEGENQPPTISLSAEPQNPVVGEQVEFTANASDSDGSVESYDWTIDGEAAGTGWGMLRVFESPGEYQVTVTAIDNEGANNTTSMTVSVAEQNDLPTVSVSADPQNPEIGEEVQFTADASDPDGSIESYEWSVDGTAVGNGSSLGQVFETSGDHQVSVTVTDSDGGTDTASTTVSVGVANDPPTVSLSAQPQNPDVGAETEITANASDPDGTIESYQWTVNGDGAGSGSNLRTTFDSSGDHEVTVTVTDDQGATDSASLVLQVSEAVAIQVGTERPAVGETVTFTARGAGSDSASSYEWVVDGEVVGNSAELEHSFDDAGDHEVVLTVTGDTGSEKTTSMTLGVEEGEDGGGGLNIMVIFGFIAVLAILPVLGILYLFIRA